MPRKSKKHWIDPKKSSKFQLVFRSQEDPQFNEQGNDRVLAPIHSNKEPRNQLQHLNLIEQLGSIEREEQREREGEKWGRPSNQRDARFDDADEDEDEDGEDRDWNIASELMGAPGHTSGHNHDHDDKGKEKDWGARFADADEDEDEDDGRRRKKPSKKKNKSEEVNLREFEVGEYGFPQDGYDYSQHFKPMGGHGAVFMETPMAPKGSYEYKKPVVSKDDVFKLDKDNAEMRQELFGPGPVSDLRDLSLDKEEGELDEELLAALNNPDEFEAFDDTFVKALKKGEQAGDAFWGDEAEYSGEEGSYDGVNDTDTRPERGEAAQIFDERFERLAEGYDDEDIGELDPDDPEVQGTLQLEQLSEAMDEFLQNSKPELYTAPSQSDQTVLRLVERQEEREEIIEVAAEPERDPWDCESIISTYSNLENHPTLIADDDGPKKITLSKKTGIPLGVLPNQKERTLKTAGEDIGKARPKEEAKEEKRARKAQVKEARKVARQQKKNVKVAYKNEEQRQLTQMARQSAPGQSIIKY